MQAKGKHLIINLKTKINYNNEELKHIMIDACKLTHATICDVSEKQFEPQGYTIAILLSESHASLHSYPECNSIFIDCFTCGNLSPKSFKNYIIKMFRPYKIKSDIIVRKC